MEIDQDISKWLATLGLEAYAQAFADSDVDLAVLPELTVEDLREIGIKSVGHRRKILSAAAQLASRNQASVVPTQDDDAGSAERRILTVMFCDLVDSTSMSSASDAEDFREFIAQFRQDVETAIRPFGGTISQFLGDGVMASFGYPRASGHDAERAVAAGLAVIEKVQRLPKFAQTVPQVRVGIATGLTVVGAFDSGVSLRDVSAIGDTPNLASRLQGEAAPNSMVIAQQTRELIGDIFECAEQDAVQLKGFATPVKYWKVLGRGSTASRFEALRTNSRSQVFVGRTAELQRLWDHCKETRRGKGRLLVIEGETGIGKSRLVQEGLSNLSPKVAEPVVLQCSPYSTNMQFFAARYLIAANVEGALQDGNFEGIGKWLSDQGFVCEEKTALIVSLMAYAEDLPEALSIYSSDQIRAKTLDLLHKILRKQVADAGAIIIEDIQWMDPSTAELMERLLPSLSKDKAVMLATSQPAPRVDWLDTVDAQILHLKGLPQDDLRQLVTVLGGDTQLSHEVVDTIIDRSDGVPIFAEELALGYLDANEFDGSARVPLSLSESLLARLDRLVNGRRIASLAAAIGREAPLSILIATSDLPASVVHTGIGELVDAGVIVPSKTLFGETIRFRHGLVREAAYDLLLRRQRKSLHRKIAETVLEHFPKICKNRPHLLANQWFHAEVFDKAVYYWTKAGEIETERSAYGEALAYFERGFEVNEKIPPSPERTEMALEIHLSRMNARICLHGFLEASEAETAEIADLVNELGSSEKAITALNLRWVYLLTLDRADSSRDFAFQIKNNEIAKTPSEKLIVLRMCATSLLFCGELEGALEHYHQFIENFDPEAHSQDMREGHSDHSVIVMMGLGEAYALTGDIAKAKHWGAKSIKAARVAHRQHDLAHTLTFAGLLQPYLTGDYDLVANSIRELDAIVSENPLANWTGFPDLFQALLSMQSGDLENSWTYAKRARDALIQSQRYSNWWQIFYIDLCMATDHWDEAIEMIEVVRPFLDRTEERFKAEFLRLMGKLHRDRYDDPQAANAAFQEGLDVANEQGAHLFSRAILKELDSVGLMSA